MLFERKPLLEAVRTVSHAVSKRAGIPALSGIRFTKLFRNDAILEATDLELRVQVSVPSLDPEAFEALVPGKALLDVLRTSKGNGIVVEATDDGLRVGPLSLRSFPMDDWPKDGGDGKREVARVRARELSDVFEKAQLFASHDEARPILTGVYLEAKDEALTAAATDSYRLIVADVRQARVHEDFVALVPADVVKLIGAHLRKQLGSVAVWLRPDSITFRCPDSSVWTSRLIQGEFPNWRDLIPDERDDQRLTYDEDEMVEAVTQADRASVDSNPLKISLNGEIELSLNRPGDVGSFSQKLLHASWKGADGFVAFKPRYLLDCIKVTDGAPAQIVSGLKPSVFYGRGRTALLMPVRL